MPSFDWVKYLGHVALIGILAGVLYFAFDQAAMPFNALIDAHMVSVPGLAGMSVAKNSIYIYAFLGLVFASVGAVLVANARSEVNSPLITTTYAGSIICFVMIVAAIAFNVAIAMTMDVWMINMAPVLAIPEDSLFWYGTYIMEKMFQFVHYCPDFMIVYGYYNMIIASLRIESLEWGL